MSLLIKGPPKFVPPVHPCWAILEAVNLTAVKPAAVRRTWEGVDYIVDCYVTRTVRDEYLAGNIALGDYVLIGYLEHNPDKVAVFAKVVKTW